MASDIVKKFKKWQKQQKGEIKEYKHKTKAGIAKHLRAKIENPEEFGKNWAEEERLEELFKLIENIGNLETKARLYIEDFERATKKNVNITTLLKLKELKKILQGIQQDLLQIVEGGK